MPKLFALAKEALTATGLTDKLLGGTCPNCGGEMDTRLLEELGLSYTFLYRFLRRIGWLTGMQIHFCTSCNRLFKTDYWRIWQWTRSVPWGKTTHERWQKALGDTTST